MRGIEFRGKEIDTNRWHFGMLTYFDDDDTYYINFKDCGDYVGTSVIPETIGQFTGKCDKNGKRIYEDDIVNISICKKYIGKYIVRWDEQFAGFYACTFEGVICFVLGIYASNQIEVIGNVHDDKEILNAGGGQ